MRKTLNVVLAVILAVAMVASFAYVATPEKSNDYQLSLVSAKAVNVQDTATGVRSYADLVDTERIYQVNEVIYLAITTEVKNLEKYPKLKSIDDKTIKVVVGSPSIDLSYSKMTNPTLLGNVWSGYTAINVATVGYSSAAGNMLTYDKNANEISWKFHGVEMFGMQGSSHRTDSMHLVTFDPFYNSSEKYIEIPAIRLKDKDAVWKLGSSTFDVKYEAPEAIGYTMVLTGVTKDNNGAQKGTFYAKLEITGAEKFVDYDSFYYAGPYGEYADTVDGLKNKQFWTEAVAANYTPVENRDFVKVDVKKLEIAGGYTVYKYFIPASGVLNWTELFYNGDYSNYNGNADTDLMVDAAASIGRANPQFFDNATNKTDKMGGDFINVAGGVRSVKAYKTYDDYLKGRSKVDVPLTSVVYVDNAMIYAPGFFGGTIVWGKNARPIDPTKGTEWVYDEGFGGNNVAPVSTQVVQNYKLYMDAEEIKNYDPSWIKIVRVDNPPVITAGWAADFYGNGFNSPTTGEAMSKALYSNARIYTATELFQMPVLGNLPEANGLYALTLTPNAAKVKAEFGTEDLFPMGKTGAEDFSLFIWYEDPTVRPVGANEGADRSTWINASQLVGSYGFSDPSNLVGGNLGTPTPVLPAINGPKFVVPYDTTSPLGTDYFYRPFVETTVAKNVATSTFGFNFTDSNNLWKFDPKLLVKAEQITAASVKLDISVAAPASTTTAKSFYNTTWPQPLSAKTETISVPFVDLRTSQPSASALTAAGNGYQGLDLSWYTPGTGVTELNTIFSYGDSASWKGSVSNTGRYVFGFKTLTVTPASASTSNKAVISVEDLYVFDRTNTAAGWVRLDTTSTGLLSQLATAINTANATPTASAMFDGGVRVGTISAKVMGAFTFYKDAGADAVGAYYSYDTTTGAGVNPGYEGRNGINVYTITTFDDEAPLISVASERTYFDSEDGYGICLFDGTSNAFGGQFMQKRIYRSNDSNLAYSDVATHVQDSAKKIAALKYFDIDTSLSTLYKVTDATFESKGASAIYSEQIEGEFKYGTITIVPDPVQEGADDTEAPMSEEPTEEVTEEPTEEVSEEVTEDPTVEPTETPVAPPTGDASVNVAIALAAAAIVAAAGLAFVMKKVR